MVDALPATVVIPTIGREWLLVQALESLTQCGPRAAEMLVVDQSARPAVRAAVERFSPAGARLIPCDGLGAARARNIGLAEAANEVVLFTDDDCTVAPTWVAVASKLIAEEPEAMFTGRVVPQGDGARVPSTTERDTAHDYTGERHIGALYSGNMVVGRSRALALGGFDERFGPAEAAEDCDFCYRWLRAGRVLRHEPKLLVWHHAWRSAQDMEEVESGYWRGLGALYAKHLRQRDPGMARFAAQSARHLARSGAAAFVRRDSGAPRLWRVRATGLVGGFRDGWRTFDPAEEARPAARGTAYAAGKRAPGG